MQLFTRTVVLDEVSPDVIGIAADLREYVSGAIGTEIGLWAAGFGAPWGTMVYAGPVDGLAGVSAMNTQLMGDATYQAKVAGLRGHIAGPAESALMNPLYGEVRADGAPPLGAVATATTAVASAPFDEVVAFGVELAQLAESVMGQPVIFGAGVAGTFGEFGWLSVAPDAAAADAANAALMANGDYIAKISGASGMFVAGAAHRIVSSRVA